MGRGLRALADAFRQAGTNLTLSVFSNLIGAALSIPVFMLIAVLAFFIHSLSVIPVGIVFLIGVLPNPALAGLQAVNRELTRHAFPNLQTQTSGLRDYWRPALRTWLTSLIVTVLIGANLVFYTTQNKAGSFVRPVATPLAIIWILLLAFWLVLHLYVYPLILAQEETSLLTTYRNAAVLAFSHPLYTGGIAAVWLALLVIFASAGIVIFFGLAVAAAIQQCAFSRLLPLMNVQPTE